MQNSDTSLNGPGKDAEKCLKPHSMNIMESEDSSSDFEQYPKEYEDEYEKGYSQFETEITGEEYENSIEKNCAEQKALTSAHRHFKELNGELDTNLRVPSIPTESDFGFIRLLSEGAFGKVIVAKTFAHQNSYCAIKVMNKKHLLNAHMGHAIVRERKILACTNRYPNLFPRLYASFQNDDMLFLVMEFIEGGDCLMLLGLMNRIPEKLIRHYLAELCMAVDHLHRHRIMHRDIKPDNLLLTASGHVKLADFGLAARLSRARPHPSTNLDESDVSPMLSSCSSWLSLPPASPRSEADDTYTGSNANGDDDYDDYDSYNLIGSDEGLLMSIIGNFNYSAPEMLLGMGYDENAEWWAVGVLAFQLLSGVTPFEDPDSEVVMENILSHNIHWAALPADISADCLSFITDLLDPDSTTRMGGHRSEKQVLEHKIFQSLNFEMIHQQPGPYLPSSNAALSLLIKSVTSTTKLRPISAFVTAKDWVVEDFDKDEDKGQRRLDDKQEDLACFKDFSWVNPDPEF